MNNRIKKTALGVVVLSAWLWSNAAEAFDIEAAMGYAAQNPKGNYNYNGNILDL